MKRVTLGILAAAAATVASQKADAYVLKKTTGDKLVHWAESHIALAVDPGVAQADRDAADAVRAGAEKWNQKSAGAPQVSVKSASKSLEPGYDGVNAVVFRDVYAPAGRAIAVTVLTYDDNSGEIVDADIVISGKYKYSTSDEVGAGRYDLRHVVAHELGHSLGLGDEGELDDALMFGFTKSGQVARREPGEDDVQGVTAIYPNGPGEGDDAAVSSGGCTAATSSRGATGPYALGLLFGAMFYGIARRKNRLLAAAPLTIAAITSFAAQASPGVVVASQPSHYVTAEVTKSESSWQGGMLHSRVVYAPKNCGANCDREVVEEMWGGHKDGLTQEIAGDHVPERGESVKLSMETGRLARVVKSPHFSVRLTNVK
jgi:hypothetical protein